MRPTPEWGVPGWSVISSIEMTRALDQVPPWFVCSVVPLVRRRGDQVLWCGSAFFLTPWGLMATARHVVVDNDDDLPEAPTDGSVVFWPPQEEVFVLLPKDLNAHGSLNRIGVRVPRISVSQAHSDAALLLADMSTYEPPPFWEPRLFPLCTDRPVEGQSCAAFGFSNMTPGDWTIDDDAWTSTSSRLEARVSQGKIAEIHNRGRDRALLPHPCFQVDTHLAGGMSGGPVLREDGAVIGIVSAGIDLASGPSEQSYGYAALIGTLYTLRVPRSIDDLEPPERFADLVKREEVPMLGREIVMIENPPGEDMVVTWKPKAGALQKPRAVTAPPGPARPRRQRGKCRRH